jgi:vacuolar-type H+-ATPase subunit H
MLPEVYFQVLILVFDLIILAFAVYYFLQIRSKEKKIEQTETKVDTNYHQIVDDALGRERKILEDAAMEADRIITSAEYVKQTSKEAIDQALSELVKQIQKESVDTATKFMADYTSSLKQLATTSLTDFQQVSLGLQADLQQQIKNFRESLLPSLDKELEEYKKMRLKQTEEMVSNIVGKASQEVFNKSISLEDHQKLLTDSLEKAKAEGVFD